MEKEHSYLIALTWTGNHGRGTADYSAFSRDHTIRAAGNPDLLGTSDTAFRGSPGFFLSHALISPPTKYLRHANDHIIYSQYYHANGSGSHCNVNIEMDTTTPDKN